MRVAIFSESPSDEVALRVLVGALLQVELEPVGLQLRSRGWPAVRQELRAVIRDLWLNRRADALVVSVDTDSSLVHDPFHDSLAMLNCRHCALRRQSDETIRELRRETSEGLLLSAVASASPAMEAWLLQGRPDAPSEASWSLYLLTQPSRYDVKMKVRELKRRVYGVGKPPQARAQLVAESEARRISADWAGLVQAFPGGFGTMAKAISTWKPGLS